MKQMPKSTRILNEPTPLSPIDGTTLTEEDVARSGDINLKERTPAEITQLMVAKKAF